MSVTTTQNVVSGSALRLLADYEVHHAGEIVEPDVVEPANARSDERVQNPAWWPTNYRRIPDYRPINRELDRELRPAGSFFMETCFILTMLGGVTMNANANMLWRRTGGKINDTYWRYPIGGEK